MEKRDAFVFAFVALLVAVLLFALGDAIHLSSTRKDAIQATCTAQRGTWINIGQNDTCWFGNKP